MTGRGDGLPALLRRRRVLAAAVPMGAFALVAVVMTATGHGTGSSWSAVSSACWPAAVLVCWPLAAVVAVLMLRGKAVDRDFAAITASLATVPLDRLKNPNAVTLNAATQEGRAVMAVVASLVQEAERTVAGDDADRDQVDSAQHLRVNFVASMGHDLRGPLNNMLGFADLLLLDDAEPVSATQRASLHRIRQRTLDLLSLIDDMLDWARLEAGRMTLEKAPQTLAKVVQGALGVATSRAAGRAFSVDVGVLPGDLILEVDLARLQHAIVAVMGAAIRADHAEPLSLSARVVGPAGRGLRRIEIIVTDPGLVVRDEDQRGFFEAFRPSYAPSGKRIAGIGLGLACARALLRAHGGDLRFTSQAGSGTEFILSVEG